MNTSTPIRRYEILRTEVDKLFPKTKLIELASFIEDGPGFKDKDCRNGFADEVIHWAIKHIPHDLNDHMQQSLSFRLEPNASKSRDLLRDIETSLQDLQKNLAALPPSGHEALRVASNMGSAKYADVIRNILSESPMIFSIIESVVVNAIKISDFSVRKNRPERHDLKQAIFDLGVVWARSSGRKPTATGSSVGISGCFPSFVCVAMDPLWPRNVRQSIDGLIRGACTELGRKGWT